MNNIKSSTFQSVKKEAPAGGHSDVELPLVRGFVNGGNMTLPTTHCYDLIHKLIAVLGNDSMKKLHYLAGGIFARLRFLGADYDIVIRPSSKGGDDG